MKLIINKESGCVSLENTTASELESVQCFGADDGNRIILMFKTKNFAMPIVSGDGKPKSGFE